MKSKELKKKRKRKKVGSDPAVTSAYLMKNNGVTVLQDESTAGLR